MIVVILHYKHYKPFKFLSDILPCDCVCHVQRASGPPSDPQFCWPSPPTHPARRRERRNQSKERHPVRTEQRSCPQVVVPTAALNQTGRSHDLINIFKTSCHQYTPSLNQE